MEVDSAIAAGEACKKAVENNAENGPAKFLFDVAATLSDEIVRLRKDIKGLELKLNEANENIKDLQYYKDKYDRKEIDRSF